MKTKLSKFIGLAVLLTAGVIGSNAAETLRLHEGQRKTVDRGRVNVTFLSVLEDSRCPINARCIRAGEAKVRIAVSRHKAAARTIELTTDSKGQAVTVYGHKFWLEDMTPRPGERNFGRRKTVSRVVILRVEKA
jgi:hypothetical protein